jgi:hypothetical protein
MEPTHVSHVPTQRLLDGIRQHGHPILATLPLPYDDLVAIEVEILDAKVETLLQPEPCPVEQHDEQTLRAGQPFGRTRAHNRGNQGDLDREYLLIQKQQRAERLILSRCAHLPPNGKPGHRSAGCNAACGSRRARDRAALADLPRYAAVPTSCQRFSVENQEIEEKRWQLLQSLRTGTEQKLPAGVRGGFDSRYRHAAFATFTAGRRDVRWSGARWSYGGRSAHDRGS